MRGAGVELRAAYFMGMRFGALGARRSWWNSRRDHLAERDGYFVNAPGRGSRFFNSKILDYGTVLTRKRREMGCTLRVWWRKNHVLLISAGDMAGHKSPGRFGVGTWLEGRWAGGVVRTLACGAVGR